MKYSFPTILLVSLCCLNGTTKAIPHPESTPTAFERVRKTLGLTPKAKKSTPSVHVTPQTETSQPKTPAKPQEATQGQKLAVVAALQKQDIAVKSLKEAIDAATDKNDKSKFGIGALVKTFREQANNNNNPQKHIFARDLPIGEKLLKVEGSNLTEATAIAKELSQETQNLLRESLERRYSLFSRLGALKEFVSTR
jgi:hypothetical protein